VIYKGGNEKGIEKITLLPKTKVVNGFASYPIVAGEFAIAKDGEGIGLSTILGSCVALMLYDEVNAIKAMNHFVLPSSTNKTDCYRFGLYSVESMINQMLKLGAKKEYLSAKIAGGANVLYSVSSNIGLKNVLFAKDFCKQENIKIVSENTLGEHGREVLLTDNFSTYIRKISSKMRDERIAQEEKIYRSKIEKQSSKSSECDITLF
jgi:chemotaxis protein CheD